MAAGFPVEVNGITIRTVEALYQACRYPSQPNAQMEIIGATSPMAAKMVSRTHQERSRPDWPVVRVDVMRWCLRVKLAFHVPRFGDLLRATGSRPIVEQSHRDSFWGARPRGTGSLVGANVLGRLLMELRQELVSGEFLGVPHVEPLEIADWRLDSKNIGPVAIREAESIEDDGQVEPTMTQGTLW